MKQKLYLLLAGLLFVGLQLKAQAPQAFNYQAVARDVAGNVMANQAIGLRFTIHQSTEVGTVVYQEQQSATTNIFGLFSASIGSGVVLSGNMSTISWGTNAYYLQVEMDPTGGTNYVNMGASQLLSVPYALYAGNGGGSSGKTYSAGKGIGIVDTVISADVSDALWNANKLRGDSISITAPINGQVLGWNGAAWLPTSDTVFTDSSLTGIGTLAGKLGLAQNGATDGQVLEWNGKEWKPTTAAGISGGWATTGNTGTTYGTNFIGTTDDQGLLFEVNGTVAGRIEDNNGGNNSYYNTSLGYQALNSITSGATGNEAFGFQALASDNTGQSNTAIGTYALPGNTSGNDNVAIGLFAIDGENGTTTGSNNTVVGVGAQYSGSGNNNTSIGGNAGHGITNSSSNVSMGYEALAGSMNNGQDPGSQNVAVGSYALFSDNAAGQNVAVGDSALTSNYGGTDNSALGYQSLASNQYATDNTAIGFDAMLNNDNDGYGSSSQNTAVGSQSLYYNIDGQWNTAEGYQALYSNQYAIQNTAVGYQALYNNDNTGDNNAWYNVAIGSQAMQANTDGQWNACLGTVALLYNTTGTQNTAIGSPAMYNNQTGDYNVALGTNALNTNVTGNYNMALGYVADVSIDGLNNATAIGAYAQAINSNSIVLGSNGTNGTAVTEIDMNGSLSPWNGSVYDPGTAGYVLQSNGAGTAPTWVAASGGGGASWNLTGNAIAYNYSATPTTFIGTTNSYGFEFGVNGGEAGRVEANYGSQNTALGWGSLQNGAGQANTAIGINAAQLASGGSYNVSMGWEAFGDYSDGGSYNVAIGGGALAGPGGSAGDGDDNNTAVGYFALVANDAANNTALGYGAASSGLNSSPATNLTGSPITAIGFETLFSNTSGSDNVALGYQSLYSNVDASTNTAIGDNALFSNGTGGGNTAVGFGALFNNAVSQNVAVGDSAMASNSTGTNNTALGYQSLSTNQTGNNITAVGYNANVASDGLTNSIALGSGATITMSNQLIIPATVTHVNMAGIPAFANDAAAGTGGLVKGDMYQTDGTGVAPLNVAGILMIKQ